MKRLIPLKVKCSQCTSGITQEKANKQSDTYGWKSKAFYLHMLHCICLKSHNTDENGIFCQDLWLLQFSI